jgi:hypothetical protein
MVKREDSTRSWGIASIGTDKPTHAKLKAAADSAGVSLSEYMRVLADNAVKGIQGGMPIVSTIRRSDSSSQIESLAARTIEMSKAIPMPESRRLALISAVNKCVKFNTLPSAQVLFNTMEEEFEAERAKVEAKARGQLELGMNLKESPV